ncbi:MAG: bacillithiol biosynthesis deacetylase BshB1 [Caldithrix sp.]|nr:bacillithiol biosynthesis deacetylase BshB1 [Caldithrix sp.]
MEQMDILAFGAHPDDVELFCGGTLIKMSRLGYNVGIIDLTQGELSTRGDVQQRKTESEQALTMMGGRLRENLDIADGTIQSNNQNRMKVIRTIRKYRPNIVLAPYPMDRHPDHEQASLLIEQAVFYSGLKKIDSEMPAYRPPHVLFYFSHRIERISFIMDISDTFEDKVKALQSYASQFYKPDDPGDQPQTYISSKRFWDNVEARARYFGSQIDVDYGEPFHSKTKLKINNLMTIFP